MDNSGAFSSLASLTSIKSVRNQLIGSFVVDISQTLYLGLNRDGGFH